MMTLTFRNKKKNAVHIQNPAELKRKAITKEKSGFNTAECADFNESLFSQEAEVEAEILKIL